jgi:hypothetical protein
VRVEEQDLKNPAVAVRPGDPCFHCGNTIACAPYVIWQGNDQNATQIGLHVECSRKLADHLQDDSQPRH